MTTPLHVVIGPAEHGVVRHGIQLADLCGHRLITAENAAAATALIDGAVNRGDVVHVPFTDRLFASTCERAAEVFAGLAKLVSDCGATLSVTLHDVPRGSEPLARRRAAAYRSVIDAARGVVVNSRVELAAVQDWCTDVHSLRCVRLPIERLAAAVASSPTAAAATTPTTPTTPTVMVLGFVYPDRGYEQVLAELPAGSALVALGRPSDGHADLADRLADIAAERGIRWQLTGFIPDSELAARLAAAAIPVAPNTRVGASGSIATWLAHGRRPLVPVTDYTLELALLMPGALELYDSTNPGALGAGIAAAIADPTRTWLDSGTTLVPTPAEVAAAYRGHLESCRPAQPVGYRDSAGRPRLLVPGNRFDLLVPASTPAPVSVIVPFYSGETDGAQADLDLVLAALSMQTASSRMEIIVADDGSPQPPDLSCAGDVAVRVVRQDHDGFGAGRARNLGAAHARFPVLAFLDADTVPEPDYVDRLTRLPLGDVDALVVGRRRHGDLAGWTPAELKGWLTESAPGPRELTEPAWLHHAYRQTRNLLDADRRSYRYLISAVLAVGRDLFDRLGGFDERFTHYGGEDWELAHRGWQAGALFAHEPTAVAWHCGPDWAERPGIDRRRAKDVETRMLATLLPDPDARGSGQWFPYPYAAVTMSGDDVAGVLGTARSAFAAGFDGLFWLGGPLAQQSVHTLADPRIATGPPPPDVLSRAAVRVDVHQPCDLSSVAQLSSLAESRGAVSTPAVTIRSNRALGRCADVNPADADPMIAQLFGWQERSDPVPVDAPLHTTLGRLSRQVVSRS